jgi:hypothetical protein
MWAMEDQKNGWRCDGDNKRDDRRERGRGNGGFCGPNKEMEAREAMKKAMYEAERKIEDSLSNEFDKA